MEEGTLKKGIGLMDGGIVDNQGLHAINLAQDRRKASDKFEEFSLVIINDVASHYMESWERSTESYSKPFQSTILKKLTVTPFLPKVLSNKNNWLIILSIVLIICSIAFTILFVQSLEIKIAILITCSTIVGILGTLLIGKIVVNNKIKREIEALKNNLINKVPSFYKPLLQNFDDLKIGLLQRMLMERLTSVYKMVSEVFLKQVRRLNYKQIYENPEWEGKRISNMIYELTDKDITSRMSRGRGDKSELVYSETLKVISSVSPKIKKIANEASAMGTTLWFEKGDVKNKVLDKLIACGQFTLCFNLIVYLIELKFDEESKYKKCFERPNHPLSILEGNLIDYWSKFQEEPMWMIKLNK